MNKKSALSWIYKHCKHIFPRLFLITLLSIAMAMCGVMLALVSKGVVDVSTGKESGQLIEKIFLLFGVILAQVILQALNSNFTIRATGHLVMDLKNHVFSALLKKDWQSVSAYHSGDLLNRLYNDINVIVTGVIGLIPTFLSLITRMVASLWYLFLLDPTFSVVIVIVGPLIVLFSRVYSKKMKFFHKKVQETDGKINSFMQESIQNLLMIKSFHSEDYIVEQSSLLQKIGYKLKIKRNTISIFANVVLYLTFSAGYYLALAWCAFRLASGAITYGSMVAFLQLFNQVQTPFMNLSSLLPQYYNMIASAERIIELELLPDEANLNQKLDLGDVYAQLNEITLKDVSFSYDKDFILEDTSFTIKKGDFIAIAGTSGVGKSTMLKLILGIIMPQQGEIYLRLQNNSTLSIDMNARRLFAYVPQGNMILSGSLRDNIKFSNESASDEAIIHCAKLADIWNFICELPDGLDTQIGERGLGLSEGQVQRIAIARALLYDAPILLLDEATSALDEKTEKQVLENLKSLEGKTCIIISHKRAALEICNRVITICAGKIIPGEMNLNSEKALQ